MTTPNDLPPVEPSPDTATPEDTGARDPFPESPGDDPSISSDGRNTMPPVGATVVDLQGCAWVARHRVGYWCWFNALGVPCVERGIYTALWREQEARKAAEARVAELKALAAKGGWRSLALDAAEDLRVLRAEVARLREALRTIAGLDGKCLNRWGLVIVAQNALAPHAAQEGKA